MVFKNIVKTYKKLLKTNLVLVQAVQAGILLGTGDIFAQRVLEKRTMKNLNFRRTGVFITLGAGYIGPGITTWYTFLSRKFPHGTKYRILKKVLADQLLFAPPFTLGIIVIINSLQGQTMEFTKNQIKLKYPDIMLNSYKLWPAAQLINFYFIPLRHQPLFVNFVALFWNTYLSWKTQHGVERK